MPIYLKVSHAPISVRVLVLNDPPARLDPTDRAMLGQVGSAWRALVASCTEGPGGYCSPRHPSHLQPSSLELPGGLSNALRTLDS